MGYDLLNEVLSALFLIVIVLTAISLLWSGKSSSSTIRKREHGDHSVGSGRGYIQLPTGEGRPPDPRESFPLENKRR